MNEGRIDSFKWQQHAWLNRLQSLLLLLVIAGFLALLGGLLWGEDGVISLVGMGIISVMMNSFIAPKWVMNLYGAKPVHPQQMPALNEALEILTQRAGLNAQPQLYLIPSQILNAFAVGTPSNSAIAITEGLLETLTLDELVAVLAHEISHIRNNDLWIMGLADMFSRTTSLLSLLGQFLLWVNLPLLLMSAATIHWGAILLLIFAPDLSALAQLSLSRTREYHADLNAVLLMGDTDALARALMKIEERQGSWMERIFLPGYKVPVPSVLRTHPETEERIKRIMILKNDVDHADWFTSIQADAHKKQLPLSSNRKPPYWHISGLWH